MITEALLAILALLIVGGAAHRLGSRRARKLRGELDRAGAELSHRLSELFSLQELSYVLAEAMTLDGIAIQVARFVGRFMSCDGALIAVVPEGDSRVHVLAAEGNLSALAGARVPEIEAGLIGVAMGREQMEVAEVTGGVPPLLMAGVRVPQAVVAPLRAHGVTIGAVAVTRNEPTPFEQRDLRLLSTVVTHAAMALANARFFELIQVGKQQWETTFDALDDGIAVVDAQGKVRRGNRALAEMLGVPLKEISGSHLTQALLGHSIEVQGFFDDVRAGRARPPLTQRSQKLRRTLRISASAIPGSMAEGWVVALVEDVTEQKALETQLIQSEKMAAVGQLVSGVAHELNNPLTSIAGLSEFLLYQPDTPEREREHLRVIHDQAERAARIVRNLLTFARKGPTDVGNVDLGDVTQRATSLVSYELRLRKIELELDLDRDGPPVHGDRYQLQQVALNLLTNAIQAVSDNPPERPRLVRVSTAHDDHGVVLRVEDTGPGIPDELASQIFDPFFTTKDPGKGTGLGLSITFGIVEGHGGNIEVLRGPAGGAVFEVRLPIRSRAGPTQPSAPATPQPATAAEPSSAPTAPGHRILLVDDDPAVRRTIGTLFSHDGHAVTAARDAGHALSLLQTTQFDLVLADSRAAVSADQSLADAITLEHADLRDRTIFLSADVRPDAEQRLEELGWRFVRKPFGVRELMRTAGEILSRG